MIQLHVEPRVTKTWEAFLAEAPPHSIALDGYVEGPPSFSSVGPHANFDHHLQVDRLSTRSTCMQVFMAVTMGLFDTFRDQDQPFAHVFVNDADQDTCLAIWVLRRPELCVGMESGQPITRLLLLEDVLDCTGGAYPLDPKRSAMREQAWVFEPYFNARMDGSLLGMDGAAMGGLIDDVGDRITAHSLGQGRVVDLDTRYDRIGGGECWALIVEHGAHARTELFASGVRAFVSVRDNGDGRWTYSLCKMSPFVRFPVTELYDVLNAEEGTAAGQDGWGGSNIIGGSPREGGSKIPPQDLERIINETLAGGAV